MEEEKKHDTKREILSYIWTIIIACAAAVLVSRYVLINAEIPSESMESLLKEDDRIFGCRLSYLFHGPERYDVVMFKYPVDEETIYIKRVIGLPGETVEIKDSKIYIDGSSEPIKEDYLPDEWVVGNDNFYFEVPKDCYFMLGDNRNISLDARFWSAKALKEGLADNEQEAEKYTYVDSDQILGRAVFKYYPHFKSLLSY